MVCCRSLGNKPKALSYWTQTLIAEKNFTDVGTPGPYLDTLSLENKRRSSKLWCRTLYIDTKQGSVNIFCKEPNSIF